MAALTLALLAAATPATAKQGAPHSYKAIPNYSAVSLSWAAPESAKQLKHHNGRDYDGDAGISRSNQKPASIYIAAEFTAAELPAGDVITSLNYFEYRPVVGVTAMIWEDGQVVREQKGNLAGYTANTWRTISLDQPYTIPAGKTIRIGFRIDHGSNMDFVAIMDNAANAKGDLRSYDGKSWVHNGRGAYLITANLANDVDEAPQGYNVYVDGVKANSQLLTATSYEFTGQTDGNHTYKVESVYGSSTYPVSKTLDILSAASYFPSVSTLAAQTEGTTAKLTWRAPLICGADNLLSWHSASDSFSNSIGGTATSNTKVWIKNEFTATDLLSFAGAKIKAIRTQFHEKEAQSIIAWVMKDGVIVQHDTVAQSTIDAIVIDQWVSLPLSTPVTIEPGHSYTYGYYMIHTPKTHPVSVNNGAPFGSKANSFSTSSPNSTDFTQSKPTWRTLESGSIPGNWMLGAELEQSQPYAASTASYNIYRNGELVKQGVTATSYEEIATSPGTFTYAVEAIGNNGKPSEKLTVKASIKVPEEYRAPLIGTSDFDAQAGTLTFDWGMDIELKHHGSPAYKAGFDEEMTMNWGSRFTAAELAPYAGYKITKLNFIIGADIPTGFKLQIHNNSGQELASISIGANEVSALGYYTLTLDSPLTITGQEDLIFSYFATLPASCSAIVVDEGPLQTGGAVVRLAGTSNWMNLGTINSTYNKYNIVISAVAAESTASSAPSLIIGQQPGRASDLQRIELSASDLREGFALEAALPTPLPQCAPAMASQVPQKYNIYRNGVLAASTTSRSYTETLPGYDNFAYQVSAIYDEVWESALSDALVIANNIKQASPAPYDLKVNADNSLQWQAPAAAPVLTYCTDNPTSYGVGMTGGTTRTTYAMQKFPADSISMHAGSLVSHIRFGLYATEVTYASIIVIKDLNIIYEQEIPVADLLKIQDGWNEIRLNEPMLIEAGHDYMFGYRLDYPTGLKPMLFDNGPATENFGNLISATASHTSWKSLKSLNSTLDGNWRIYTTLMKPADVRRQSTNRTEDGLTYNVYRNGVKIKENLTTTFFAPQWLPNASNLFTVTAVKNGVESAHSNVAGNDNSGVGSIESDASLRYDNASEMIITDCAGTLYDVAGHKIANIQTSTSVSHLSAGTYLLHTTDGRTLKFCR